MTTNDFQFDVIKIASSLIFATMFFSFINKLYNFSVFRNDTIHTPFTYDKYRTSLIYFTYKIILFQVILFVLEFDTMVNYINYLHVLIIAYDYINSSILEDTHA
jgi:hypothetical protein